ncbi:hypothetical protein HK097_002667, partial [Rhizophlyctis rosea]
MGGEAGVTLVYGFKELNQQVQHYTPEESFPGNLMNIHFYLAQIRHHGTVIY